MASQSSMPEQAAANSSPEGYMRFAIPKKGRLYEKCSALLSGAGVEYTRQPRLDVAYCHDLKLTLVFLPAADIATYVGEGNVTLGITGEDVVRESCAKVATEMKLGFGRCRLCVQAQVSKGIQCPSEVAGGRIVTSFTNIAGSYFEGFDKDLAGGAKTKIKFVSGSVEAACGLGLADAVVDLVETGTTMRVGCRGWTGEKWEPGRNSLVPHRVAGTPVTCLTPTPPPFTPPLRRPPDWKSSRRS